MVEAADSKPAVSEDYLEVVLLKCPQCGGHIIEPSWWQSYNPERKCSTCGNEFEAKAVETDRKTVKFLVEKEKIKLVDLKE